MLHEQAAVTTASLGCSGKRLTLQRPLQRKHAHSPWQKLSCDKDESQLDDAGGSLDRHHSSTSEPSKWGKKQPG
jgi:hypothetical protein